MKAMGLGVLLGALLFFGMPFASEAKNACLCSCYNTEPFFTNLSAGKTSCTDDCTAMCGSGELEGEQLLVTDIACIPNKASDCNTGTYAKYKGVNCVLGWVDPEDRGGRTWLEKTGGYAPRCDIPITPENANIECQQFGGVAQGGACGPLQNNENQDLYYISRPYLGGMVCNSSGCQSAEAEDYSGNYDAAKQEGDKDAPNPNDGICYRYGFYYGGKPTYSGFIPNPNDPGYKDPGYVCLARRKNTCGTVPDPRTGQSARNFSCQPSVSLSGDTDCFNKPSDGWDEDYCGGTEGTWCCEGGTALPQCVLPSDCTGDRTCINGQCVKNTVCDGLNPDRTCRRPTYPWEITNVCSPNPNLPSNPTLCDRPDEYCCEPPAEAAGSCAGDLAVKQGSGSAYEDFECISTENIQGQRNSQGQIVGISDENTGGALAVGGDRELGYNANTYQNHCLTSSVVVNVGGSAQARNRCGTGTICCNPSKVSTAPPVKNNQKEIGQGCGTQPSTYVCADVNALTPDKATLDAFGQTQEEYLTEMATLGVCEVTPLPGSSSLYANKECVSGGLCCNRAFQTGSQCGGPDDAPCAAGLACDPVIRACVDAGYLEQRGASCAGQALMIPGADVAQIQDTIDQNGGEDKFSCEYVESGRTDLNGVCVPNGCGGAGVPAGLEGFAAACCVQGTGITASQAAQRATEGGEVTEQAPWTIKLSPCIKTGDCQLPDLLYSAAGFANFLLQISGAVFLAIFVYAGFLYLTAGTADGAAKGKKMILQASVAMAILFASYTLIAFVQRSLIGATVENEAQSLCEQTPGYQCQFLQSDPNDEAAVNEEISNRKCERNKCPGPDNFVCCPL